MRSSASGFFKSSSSEISMMGEVPCGSTSVVDDMPSSTTDGSNRVAALAAIHLARFSGSSRTSGAARNVVAKS